jgi:hypothetical protein
MKKNLLVFGCVWALSACAPPDHSSSFDTSSDISGGGGGGGNARPGRVCYPGPGEEPVCFKVTKKSSIDDPKDLYTYADPYRDPSFPTGFNKAQYLPPDRLLELSTVPGQTRLADHFVRREVMADGEIRGRFALFSPAALGRMESLRREAGSNMTVNSGYRSPGYNRGTPGAKPWSRHMYGDAIDFKIAGMSFKRVAELCTKHGAKFTQIYAAHIHCDWRGLPLDRALFPGGASSAPTMQPTQSTKVVPQFASAGTGRIVVRTDLQTSSAGQPTMVLGTEVQKEDDGELLHEWRLRLPDGRTIVSEAATPVIPKQPGTYEVQVTVGGSLIFERRLVVPPVVPVFVH